MKGDGSGVGRDGKDESKWKHLANTENEIQSEKSPIECTVKLGQKNDQNYSCNLSDLAPCNEYLLN